MKNYTLGKKYSAGFVNGKMVVGIGYAYDESSLRYLIHTSDSNTSLYKRMLQKILILKALNKNVAE